MEASGTSGQKASLNGAPNASILDGWWAEGFTRDNGWAISDPAHLYDSSDVQDDADARALYDVLENQIAPRYYTRDGDGIPRAWIQMMKAAIRTVAPRFSTRRMVKEYAAMYVRAMSGG
jgi:starch phosphorylase